MLLDANAIKAKVDEVNKISDEFDIAQKDYEDMGKLLKEIRVYKAQKEKELKDLISGKTVAMGDYNETDR